MEEGGGRRGGGAFTHISLVMEISKKDAWNVERFLRSLSNEKAYGHSPRTFHWSCSLRNISKPNLCTNFPQKEHQQLSFLTSYILSLCLLYIHILFLFLFIFNFGIFMVGNVFLALEIWVRPEVAWLVTDYKEQINLFSTVAPTDWDMSPGGLIKSAACAS